MPRKKENEKKKKRKRKEKKEKPSESKKYKEIENNPINSKRKRKTNGKIVECEKNNELLIDSDNETENIPKNKNIEENNKIIKENNDSENVPKNKENEKITNNQNLLKNFKFKIKPKKANKIKKKTSWVWYCFKLNKEIDHEYICLFCGKHIKATGSSTSHLREHLNNLHESEANFFENESLKGKDVQILIEEKIKKYNNSDKLQQNLDRFLKRNNNELKKENTKKIISWFKIGLKFYLPFSFLGSDEFLQHMKLYHQSVYYNKKILSNDILDSVFISTKEKIKKIFQKVDFVSLTTDTWTSINSETFICITAHFIDDNFIFRRYTLSCSKFYSNETGSNLAEIITEIKKEFLGNTEVVAIVHDNARNITLCSKILMQNNIVKYSVGCFAHTLQLVVSDGLKYNYISDIDKARNIIKKIKGSNILSSKLSCKTEKALILG